MNDRNRLDELMRVLEAEWTPSDAAASAAIAREALPLARGANDRRAVARSLWVLGRAAIGSDNEESLRMIDEAAEIYREIGDRQGEGHSLEYRGNIMRFLGDFYEAEAAYTGALEAFRDVEDHSMQALVLTYLMTVKDVTGKPDDIFTFAEESLRICEEHGLDEDLIYTLTQLARIVLERGDADGALRIATRAQGALHDSIPPWVRSSLIFQLTWIHVKRKEYEKARELAEQTLELVRTNRQQFTEANIAIHEGNLLTALGSIHEELHDYERALEYYHQRMELWSGHGADARLRSLDAIAQCLVNAGRLEEAMATVQEMERLEREVPNPARRLAIDYYYYHLNKLNGDFESALEHHEEYVHLDKQVFSEEATLRMQQLQVKFDVEQAKKDAEIERLRSEQLQQQLDSQRVELAAQAMHIARQTEMLSKFRNELRSILRQADKAETAIRAIKEKLQELPTEAIDWAKFEAEFQQSYPDFRSKLVAKHPELTKMEVKICSMLKLKLSTADMASLFCLSERSIENRRYSIRKKLGLKQGEDLRDILETI